LFDKEEIRDVPFKLFAWSRYPIKLSTKTNKFLHQRLKKKKNMGKEARKRKCSTVIKMREESLHHP
jgi:hypothetical protein